MIAPPGGDTIRIVGRRFVRVTFQMFVDESPTPSVTVRITCESVPSRNVFDAEIVYRIRYCPVPRSSTTSEPVTYCESIAEKFALILKPVSPAPLRSVSPKTTRVIVCPFE